MTPMDRTEALSRPKQFAHIDYSGLPESLRDGAQLYIEHGLDRPGDFMTAVICNDLREACARADDINRDRLFHIVSWFYNEAPSECWGSREKMAQWTLARTQERAA